MNLKLEANACIHGTEQNFGKKIARKNHMELRRKSIVGLTREALDGKKSSEGRLVKECLQYIRSELAKFSLQNADRDDLAQETMIVLVKQIRSRKLEKPEKIISYVRSIARNQFFMQARKNRRVSSYLESQSSREQSGFADPPYNFLSMQQSLEHTWRRLSVARDQALITDIVCSDAGKKDLSQKYEVSLEHFDRIVYRARRRFESAWQTTTDL